jgi:hypothetical protein
MGSGPHIPNATPLRWSQALGGRGRSANSWLEHKSGAGQEPDLTHPARALFLERRSKAHESSERGRHARTFQNYTLDASQRKPIVAPISNCVGRPQPVPPPPPGDGFLFFPNPSIVGRIPHCSTSRPQGKVRPFNAQREVTWADHTRARQTLTGRIFIYGVKSNTRVTSVQRSSMGSS